ncbi:C40 family peptidase [Arthrobacter mobilis]|uniref:C40 family peptidase n=1 Tax=Arthrobacter mobilis TaxID=2724944 RepID=UPI0028B0EA57|nr:NlpC/P60 family protein [Arthrobacter mobilis]
MFKSNRARHRATKSSPFTAVSVGRSAAVITAASGLVLSAGLPANAYAGNIETESYTAPASQTTAAPAAAAVATSTKTHTVLPGDTLSKIAAQYGVDLADVFAANGLNASSVIYPGDVIKLSGSAQASQPAQAAKPAAGGFTVNVASTSIKPAAVAAGNSITNIAKSMVGTPYVWGGTSTAGWDCSGFVQWVYAKVGISLPRVSHAQAAALKPTSNPQPGDIVLQNGGNHIGIYLGGGMMISALNPNEGTKVHPVSWMPLSGYYTAR